jgi:hypothetical protein
MSRKNKNTKRIGVPSSIDDLEDKIKLDSFFGTDKKKQVLDCSNNIGKTFGEMLDSLEQLSWWNKLSKKQICAINNWYRKKRSEGSRKSLLAHDTLS